MKNWRKTWRKTWRQLALNLGILAAMWALDTMGWLPRLYPRLENGVPTWDRFHAPAGILLVAITLGFALLIEWRKSAVPRPPISMSPAEE